MPGCRIIFENLLHHSIGEGFLASGFPVPDNGNLQNSLLVTVACRPGIYDPDLLRALNANEGSSHIFEFGMIRHHPKFPIRPASMRIAMTMAKINQCIAQMG